MSSPSWRAGDYLTHRTNPELGIGRVSAVDGRVLVIDFPKTGARLKMAAHGDALLPVDLSAGRPVRLLATREETTIAARREDGLLQLANGSTVAADALWPLQVERSLLERLAAGDVDDARDLLVRLDALHLLSIREAQGLGSFLGGRIRLFPHQLYVAERATAAHPVRWLLADEVGLGKTIEACLILNHLVHTGRVERCLVVAPDALTVQWLGELWRKYHQVFTLLDAARLADVARDFGAGFNPFDVHRRAVIALETLVAHPELTAQAAAAGIDLLVVDEAQRLRRPPGHPGAPEYRAIAPIAALGRHVLLLSATPLEDDAHGFFRLLQLLQPAAFPDGTTVEERLALAEPLPPCTSATRRSDIGGLPPRVGVPIAVDDGGWQLRRGVERALREAAAPHAVAERQKVDRVRRALASGAALLPVLGPDETALREQAQAMDARDPRLQWLLAHAPAWRAAGEKTLVFVAHRETLELVRTALSHRAQLASGVFHEALSPARRDTEVARFREPDGPSLLVSTEAGGEGRNFEFCRRLVLFDLPWRPTTVEQRIGRLDRIGRRIPVEIVYFQPPDGAGADAVRLFEALGVFREPLAGLEPQLAHVEEAIEAMALDPDASLTGERLEQIVAGARAARTRIRDAAYQQLHQAPYRPDLAPAILSRVPARLDAVTERVVVSASLRLGFHVEPLGGRRRYAIEFGNNALVDSLPGVPAGSSWVGTCDRDEAVEDETVDFFASGHSLVEGILAHIEDTPDGRVARLELHLPAEAGEGIAVIYKDGPAFDVVVFDAELRPRPAWAAAFRQWPLPLRPMRRDVAGTVDWHGLVQRIAPLVDPGRRPHAVAAIAVRAPRRAG